MALPQNQKKKSLEVFKKLLFMASNYSSNDLYILEELQKVLLKSNDIQMVVRRNVGKKLTAQCKLLQKIGIFRWSSRPRMQENASTTGPSLFYTSKLNSQKQWLAESCQILQFPNFQASPGKSFHNKSTVSRNPRGFFGFAQWIICPQMVPHQSVQQKM